jgi:hypothetical protein
MRHTRALEHELVLERQLTSPLILEEKKGTDKRPNELDHPHPGTRRPNVFASERYTVRV